MRICILRSLIQLWAEMVRFFVRPAVYDNNNNYYYYYYYYSCTACEEIFHLRAGSVPL